MPCLETAEAIERAVRPWGGLLEVGAGSGYWSAVLAALGLQVSHIIAQFAGAVTLDRGRIRLKPDSAAVQAGGLAAFPARRHPKAAVPRDAVLIRMPEPRRCTPIRASGQAMAMF